MVEHASRRARQMIWVRDGRGWYDKTGRSYIEWVHGGHELHHLPGEEPPGWPGLTLE